MKRDKVVDLMPDEEIALRRISYGIVGPGDLKPSITRRLSLLAFIETRGATLALTRMGARRLAFIPNSNLGEAPLGDDKHVVALAKALSVKC